MNDVNSWNVCGHLKKIWSYLYIIRCYVLSINPEKKSTFTNTVKFSVFLGILIMYCRCRCRESALFSVNSWWLLYVLLTCKNRVVVCVRRQRDDAFTVCLAEVALVQVEPEGLFQVIHGAAVVARVDQSNSFQEERLLWGPRRWTRQKESLCRPTSLSVITYLLILNGAKQPTVWEKSPSRTLLPFAALCKPDNDWAH